MTTRRMSDAAGGRLSLIARRRLSDRNSCLSDCSVFARNEWPGWHASGTDRPGRPRGDERGISPRGGDVDSMKGEQMEIVAHDAEDFREQLKLYLRVRLVNAHECGNAAKRITGRQLWRWKEEAYRDVFTVIERAVIEPYSEHDPRQAEVYRSLHSLDRLFSSKPESGK